METRRGSSWLQQADNAPLDHVSSSYGPGTQEMPEPFGEYGFHLWIKFSNRLHKKYNFA
jgi:hypothetical protein